MYCGNNANHPGLLNGTQVLGTRYSCLLKGKNLGLSLPPDPSFRKPYAPIDPTRKYCGNSQNVPNGYNRFGSLYECYLTGVGVGKKIKSRSPRYRIASPPPPVGISSSTVVISAPSKGILIFLTFIGIFLSFFLGFYYGKPSFILDNTDPQKPKIDWTKFLAYLAFFSIILTYIVQYFF